MALTKLNTYSLPDNAVTSAKIGVNVILAEDIASNAVTVAEIQDDAVTIAKTEYYTSASSAPGSAAAGDLWYDTSTCLLYTSPSPRD